MEVYMIGARVKISLLETTGEIVEIQIREGSTRYKVMYVVNNDVSFCDFEEWQLTPLNVNDYIKVGFIKNT